MAAVPYARYSTANQNELSIAAQLRGIRDYCEKEGITLRDTPYIDEAKTGTNTNRAGFNRLVEDARRGLFDAVVVYDLSRGSRDVVDWFGFRKEMPALGVRVLSATNTLGDLDDPNAFISELLTVGIGQHQVLQSRQKSIAGKRKRARRGLFCGGHTPLGYDIVDGHYVINPREAEGVRMIFEMYASGHSYNQIIDECRRIGLRGKQGKPLMPNTLYFILSNERYTGKFIWFDEEVRHMHKRVGRKSSDPIVREGVIPRIVSPETWVLVRKRMDENKRRGYGGKRNGREYLLSGLVRCGECGSAMSGITTTSKGHTYKQYTCLGKKKEHKCDLRNLRADPIEKYLIEQIKHNILAPELLEEVAQQFMEQLASLNTGEAGQIKREMAALKQKTDNLITLVENGQATPEVIQKLHDNDAHRVALEQRLASCGAPVELSYDDVLATLTADAQRLANDPSAAREMVLRYVESVTVYDLYIDISYAPAYAPKQEKRPATSDQESCEPRGSSGKTRTYNPSVNSRMLCH